MPQNPLSYPATVIRDSGDNKKGYDNYLGQLKENVLLNQEREKLKKAKIDEGLLPLELDWKDMFPGDIQEIKNLEADYHEVGMKYAEEGVDWMQDPNASRERMKLEGKIRDQMLKSKQHQALGKNLIEKASQDGFDNDFLRAESYDKFAKFQEAGDNGGINARDQFLKDQGALIVPKPWDINAFMTDYTKDIETTFLQDETFTSTVPGYKKATRTFFLSPDELNGRTQVMLRDKNFGGAITQIYDNLPQAEQALINNEAQLKGYTDARQVLAEQELRKFLQPKQEIEDLKLNAPKSGPGPTTTEDGSETMWLIDKLASARAGDMSALSEFEMNGKKYHSLQIPQFQFDTYTDYIPAVYAEDGITVIKPAEQKQVGEKIEELIYDPESQKWYAYTNKTLAKQKGSPGSPKPYGWEMTDVLWTKLLRGIMSYNAGTNKFSQKELKKYLTSLGAELDNGEIDWSKINNTSGVGWGGNTGGTGTKGTSGVSWGTPVKTQ